MMEHDLDLIDVYADKRSSARPERLIFLLHYCLKPGFGGNWFNLVTEHIVEITYATFAPRGCHSGHNSSTKSSDTLAQHQAA
jgi:hypothetical protein